MDAERFDRIARILAVAPSRRGLLGLTVGSLIALLGWEHADVKKKKGKGKGRKGKRGKTKTCGACGSCQSCVNGACQPKLNGTVCGGVCEECRNGACAAKDDGTDCGNGDTCLGGVCGCVAVCGSGQVLDANCECVCTTQSCNSGCCDDTTCRPVGASQTNQKCGSNGAECAGCGADAHCTQQGACECDTGFELCDDNCVPSCDGEFVLDANCQCICPNNRESCGGDVCCASRKICVGNTCVTGRGTCEEGANTCPVDGLTDPLITCNAQSDCHCFQSTDGDTRCGQLVSNCRQCDADSGCEEFGPTAFCVDGAGPVCCQDTGQSLCAIPCPADPPGVCPAGADSCLDPFHPVLCNGRADCFCVQVEGETRCLMNPVGSECNQCAGDDGCTSFGEGAVCFIDDRPGCACSEPGKGFCMAPCPEFDPAANRVAAAGAGSILPDASSPGSRRKASRKSSKSRKRKPKR